MMTTYRIKDPILVELKNVVTSANAIIGYTAYTIVILPNNHYKFGSKILQNMLLRANQNNSTEPYVELHVTQMDSCSAYDQAEINFPITFSEVTPYSRQKHIPQASNSNIAEYWNC